MLTKNIRAVPHGADAPVSPVAELVTLARATPGEERSIGANLGFSLAGKAAAELADQYAQAVGVPRPSGEGAAREQYLKGYEAAIRDVCVAYLLGKKEAEATDPAKLGAWLLSQPTALGLLKRLQSERVLRFDTAVAGVVPSERPAVQQALDDLRARRIVFLQGKWFGLSLLGEQTLACVAAPR